MPHWHWRTAPASISTRSLDVGTVERVSSQRRLLAWNGDIAGSGRGGRGARYSHSTVRLGTEYVSATWVKARNAKAQEDTVFEGLFQPMHLIIILAIVLIVFGPGKLPDIGGALGRGIKEFKTSVNDEVATPSKTETTAAPAAPAQTAPTAQAQAQAPAAQAAESPKQPS